jgi:hypothetical protein
LESISSVKTDSGEDGSPKSVQCWSGNPEPFSAFFIVFPLFSPSFPSDFFACSIAWWTCQSLKRHIS